ncbi:MAG: flagellar biosynthesis protein FliQ [Pseudomonadota bacterium]
MSPEMVVELGQEVLWITSLLAAPLLLSALGVGLLIGIVQAATQIQEMTLSFIPKLIAMVLALFLAGHWMLQLLTDFTVRLFQNIPHLIGMS